MGEYEIVAVCGLFLATASECCLAARGSSKHDVLGYNIKLDLVFERFTAIHGSDTSTFGIAHSSTVESHEFKHCSTVFSFVPERNQCIPLHDTAHGWLRRPLLHGSEAHKLVAHVLLLLGSCSFTSSMHTFRYWCGQGKTRRRHRHNMYRRVQCSLQRADACSRAGIVEHPKEPGRKTDSSSLSAPQETV